MLVFVERGKPEYPEKNLTDVLIKQFSVFMHENVLICLILLNYNVKLRQWTTY